MTELFNTMGAKPPAEAETLFDDTSLDGWTTRESDSPGWRIADVPLEVVPGNPPA